MSREELDTSGLQTQDFPMMQWIKVEFIQWSVGGKMRLRLREAKHFTENPSRNQFASSWTEPHIHCTHKES